jgi:hypothetical protein
VNSLGCTLAWIIKDAKGNPIPTYPTLEIMASPTTKLVILLMYIADIFHAITSFNSSNGSEATSNYIHFWYTKYVWCSYFYF